MKIKRFIARTLLFLAPAVITLVAAEVLVRSHPNSYQFKAQWMNTHAPQVKTLILGGSHNYYAIDPREVGDSVFNLANVSQLPEYDYLLLSHYISNCVNLKTVVVAIDYTNVFDPMFHDGVEWYRNIYYNIYMDCGIERWNPRYNLELANGSVFVHKFRSVVCSVLGYKTLELDCDSMGFGCNYKTSKLFDPQYLTRTAIRAVNMHRCTDWTVVEKHTQYLLDIIELCNKRGIKVLAVTTPCWSGYWSRLDDKQLNTMYSVVRKCEKCEGFEYLDFMRDERFQGLDFYDADHLSQQGAVKFSHILREHLNNK